MQIVKINEEYIELIKKTKDISNNISAIKKELASVRLNLDKVYDGRVDFDTRLRNAEKKLTNQASKMKTLSDVIESTIGDIMQIDNVQPQINVESGNPAGVIQMPSLQESLKHWSNFKERYSTSRWKEVFDSALPIVGGITGWTTIISTAQDTAKTIGGEVSSVLEIKAQWKKEKAMMEKRIHDYMYNGKNDQWNTLKQGRTSYSCWQFSQNKLESRGLIGKTPEYNTADYNNWKRLNRTGTFVETSAAYIEYLIVQQNKEPLYNIYISNGREGTVHTMLIDKAYIDEYGELKLIFSDNKDLSKPYIKAPTNTQGKPLNRDGIVEYAQLLEQTEMSKDEFLNGYHRDGKLVWQSTHEKAPTTFIVYGKQ